ncbi:ATP-binding protein [Candidatus Odyssella acanthamoebae]|uniref:ATP-binding protein n=1 Tax=Candidatus Odyssella acanthamoebae TaxID=91604 RepID=UPI00068ED05C|nr:ATP-binding protein [Candidatus Paracaedibacter acanthamoebae]
MTLYSLTECLKRLRLSGILESYEVRLSQARENALSHNEWLELLLQDEIQRRDNTAFIERIKKAKFEQEKTLESFEMARYPLKVQHLIRDLAGGSISAGKQRAFNCWPYRDRQKSSGPSSWSSSLSSRQAG